MRSRYPFELITPKNDDSMNSTFGHRDAVDKDTAVVTIHPADAARRNITNGTLVRISNGRGSCDLRARVSDDVRRGVVSVRSMRWNKRFANSFGLNQLTSERLTDIGGGPTFYSCLVDIAPTFLSDDSALPPAADIAP
jgi:anaerobic selenocysteine-containing dehydrogenase